HRRPLLLSAEEQRQREDHRQDEVGDADAEDRHEPATGSAAELGAAVEDDRDVGAPREAGEQDVTPPGKLHRTPEEDNPRGTGRGLETITDPDGTRTRVPALKGLCPDR